jgi:hypothetical protein
MTDGDVRWLAGIFEGEGCLSFSRPRRSQPTGYWQAGVSMTDEDVVRKFHQIIGIGHLYDEQPQRAGNKLAWKWYIGRQEDVLNFCALMQPYMGERRAAKMAECIGDLTS